jgi:hypothetical protein
VRHRLGSFVPPAKLILVLELMAVKNALITNADCWLIGLPQVEDANQHVDARSKQRPCKLQDTHPTQSFSWRTDETNPTAFSSWYYPTAYF